MSNKPTDIEQTDRAVYAYLHSICPHVVYSPTTLAQKRISKRIENQDKQPWSFISYTRDSRFDIDWTRMNNPSTISGRHTSTVGDKTSRLVTKLKNVPVNLTYHIEIWSPREVEVQSLAIALIVKIFSEDQVLEVSYENLGGNKDTLRYHIQNVLWTDSSDLTQDDVLGKLYRHSISFTLDAQITSSVTHDEYGTLNCVPVDIYID